MSDPVNNIRHLAALIKKNPADSFPKFALALELLKQDEVSKARILFESILEQDPGYLGVYYHLGKLYEQTGSTGKAVAMYEKGIGISEQQNDRRTLSELREALINLQSDMHDE